jgi:hypothetical protein
MESNNSQDIYNQCSSLPYFSELIKSRKDVILEIAKEIGVKEFKELNRLNKAVAYKNYELAAVEILNLKLNENVNVNNLVNVMRLG